MNYIWTSRMKAERRLWALLALTVTITTVVAGTAVTLLYRTGLRQEGLRLRNIVESQARLLQAVAEFDIRESSSFPGGPLAATLSQFVEASAGFSGIGETGEFTLARREGDAIQFLVRQRAAGPVSPVSIPLAGDLAEPMRRALRGEAGTMVGLDYAGNEVLAAYEPVGMHDLGIVAKVDLWEVRAPYLRAGLIAGGLGVMLILIGSGILARLSRPLLDAVRQSERKFQLIAENTVDGIWVMDHDLRFTYVNQAVTSLLGYSVDEWVGTSLEDHCSSEDFERARALTSEMEANPGQFAKGIRVEIELFKKDGSRLPAEITARPISGGAGGIQYQGVTRDISDRKAYERALKEREREARVSALELEAAFQASPLAMFTLDAEGCVVRWNPAAEGIFGWTENEVKGHLLPVVPEESLDEFRSLREWVLSGGSFTGMEIRRRRRDGSELQVRLSTAPLRDWEGAVTGIMAVMEDITLERAASDALKESERLLRAIVTSVPRGVVQVLDRDLRYRFSAGEELERLNLKDEELRGKSIHEVLAPGVSATVEANYRKVLNGETVRFEREVAGESFLVTSAPLRDANGEVERILTLSLNVSEVVQARRERQKAESALRESNERLSLALRGADLGFWDVSVSSREWISSEWLRDLLGYGPGELDSTIDQWKVLLHPDDREGAFERASEYLKGNLDAYTAEYRLRCKNGDYRWIRSRGRTMEWDPDGAPSRILGTHLDITEERNARRTETLFETVLEQMPLGYILVDVPSGKLTHHNSQARSILGRPDLEAASPADYRRFGAHHQDGKPFKSEEYPVSRVLASGQPVLREETSYRLPNGEWRILINSATPVLDDEGEMVAVVNLFEDATEGIRASRELEEQRELLQAIFDHAPTMMAVVDSSGNWRMVNREFLNRLGWNLEELRREPEVMRFLYPNPETRRRVSERIREGTGEWGDFRTRTKSGEVLDTTWANVKLGDGSTVGIGQDISHRKRLERSLRKLNAELEDRVRERTKELEDVNRELEAFSYTVSHDLKAPLRAIDGFSSILEEEFSRHLGEDAQRLITLVRKNADSMRQLIDDLLEFSRVGRVPIKVFPVDLGELVATSVEDIRADLQAAEVELELKDLPEPLADAGMLRQAIVNLLSNAAKFTRKETEPRIRVGGYVNVDEVVFFVEDNGVGFDPEYGHRLFSVFQRLHHPDDFPGTGIGLAIVRRIVERHGGRVWAEGRVGKGATFFIGLPLEPDAEGKSN